MGFLFVEICTLFSRLEDVEIHDPPLLNRVKQDRAADVLNKWFQSHRRKIHELDVDGTCALLSTLLPQWRTDRVFGMQEANLSRIICRILSLGVDSRKMLEEYKRPGRGDLATCLERVVTACGTQAIPPVGLEELDSMLHMLAGGSAFSDPTIPRLPPGSSEIRDRVAGGIFKRLGPMESKWIVKLILKNFHPLRIDDSSVLMHVHLLLPGVLRFQRSFRTAVNLLKTTLREYPEQPDPRSQRLLCRQAAEHLRPVVGTKIGPPNFYKARSIDHCLSMLGSQRWVLERKLDGEYVELHVDLRISHKPIDCIKIYSKSGKDSTLDRSCVHQTLIKALRLGEKECKFKKQAILLGELVVFSDIENRIMPFEKIRKYVTRSGRRIGTKDDSQPNSSEHLAIVFFDLLLLDNEVVMNKSVDERRAWLRESYQKIPGRAMSAEWKIIDFGSDGQYARTSLISQFAASNARRCEGLVLKPCGVPYTSLEANHSDYNHSYIKLKKDYINGMGEEADFAVIGASYKAQQATSSDIKWTSFHLACLVNKDDVQHRAARPLFKYVATIDQEHCIPRAVLEAANSLTVSTAQPCFDIEPSQLSPTMDIVFDKPLVFEVLGSDFERPSDANFLMLRHPRVKKLHKGRPWIDCITFQELQEQGNESRNATIATESQETLKWIAKLEKSCRGRKTGTPRAKSSKHTPTPTNSTAGLSRQDISPREPSLSRVTKVLSTPLPSDGLCPPSSSPLQHHETIMDSCKAGRKRRSEDPGSVNCTPLKKRRIEEYVPSASSLAMPLVEITNNTDALSGRLSSKLSRHSKALPSSLRKPKSFSFSTMQAEPPSALDEHSRGICSNSRCLFSNSTIFLAPCISQTPYIASDLLGLHDALVVSSLAHWDRSSYAHPPLTETVSESQSHGEMRKIALVESKRGDAVKKLVGEILSLDQGGFKERVMVFDWRVLEHCREHQARGKDGGGVFERYFVGATAFDDTQDRAIFVVSAAGY